MTQTAGWILEEMARVAYADRLAEAARHRLAMTVPRTYVSPRTWLATALWTLATLLDDEPGAKRQPIPRGAAAF